MMSQLEKRLWVWGAILLGIAVILGAFGAHALKQKVDAQALGWWETAAAYHRIHALAILALAAVLPRLSPSAQQQIKKIASVFVMGLILFSGSLYIMTVTQMRALGAITPLGGSAWILAWFWLARVISKEAVV